MSAAVDSRPRLARPVLGTFERYLTLWVALCILTGIVLGRFVPGPFQALGRMTIAQVNIPVAVRIWLMIVPMLIKVDFGALHRVAEQWRGIAVTVGINWLVKPFSMALLGWFSSVGCSGLATLGADRQLYRRVDPARGSTMHGDGLRVVEPDGWRAEFHADAGRAERHDHGVRVRADCRSTAWSVLDYRARRPGDRRAGLATLLARLRWRSCGSRHLATAPADIAPGAPRDARAAVRLSGRSNRRAAGRNRAARDPEHHPSVFERRYRLLAQSSAGCAPHLR